ncbi:DUF4166 domain-containing protein [Paremcibacter congregatus]|uniref:DUF4166 domain-containing protein n=1 Tax=Paremcibacter congregatus TaxID=2043170 RepID=A0A2G4YST5_9PROT|nr:DUF4166 domain-containing protein [Paremcibacter congregatus]PHZ85337.1 hypothetical protein CRD36_08020 [Paremcibacter congregatus]QDE27732.1 DUF4166 domain-containing protein [Paremcibacter congregatus]
MTQDPIFKTIFGEDWNKLPPVMHKHYANRPYTTDLATVEGTLDVMCAGPIKFLAPIFWLMRGIPPHTEVDVSVVVNFESDEESNFFHFRRIFNFKTRKPYSFNSRMMQIKDNEVVEIMWSGFGWRMHYVWEAGRVKLKHKGYVFHLFGCLIPLPLTFLLGEGNAEEIAIDDNSFDMKVTITHPWWGKVYQYGGRFKVKKNI